MMLEREDNMSSKRHSFHKELLRIGKESKRSSIFVYFTLRFLVIICMIMEFLRGEINNAFLCLFSLILFIMPFFIEKKFKIELPNTLEIIIMLFIFSAEILGEINNFYGIIPYWDTLLHTLNGFLAAGVGFALFDLLNQKVKSIHLSPLFLAMFSFCFSMTVGVLWEFYEYGADMYFKTDMQKDKIINEINSVYLNEEGKNKVSQIEKIDYTLIYGTDQDGNVFEYRIDDGYLDIGLNDTMKDLLVNFIGASIFSLFGYLYILNRDKYGFIDNFLPFRRENIKN